MQKCVSLKRRLMIEISLVRALNDAKKLTMSYIKYMEELISSCAVEKGNGFLIDTSKNF